MQEAYVKVNQRIHLLRCECTSNIVLQDYLSRRLLYKKNPTKTPTYLFAEEHIMQLTRESHESLGFQ